MRSWSCQKEACLPCLGRIVGHSEVKTPVSEILNLRIARHPPTISNRLKTGISICYSRANSLPEQSRGRRRYDINRTNAR
jgi:hypothetical protein